MQVFRISTPFKEKSSDHFKDIHKMELLTNLGVNLTPFLEELWVNRLTQFGTPPRNDVILTSKFVRSFSL